MSWCSDRATFGDYLVCRGNITLASCPQPAILLGMTETTIRRHLRGALTVGALLVPTTCAFPVLAALAPSPLRWLILMLWLGVAFALGVLVQRVRRLFDAFAEVRGTNTAANANDAERHTLT